MWKQKCKYTYFTTLSQKHVLALIFASAKLVPLYLIKYKRFSSEASEDRKKQQKATKSNKKQQKATKSNKKQQKATKRTNQKSY